MSNNYDFVFFADGNLVAAGTAKGETSLHALENNIENFDLPKNVPIKVKATDTISGLTVEHRISKGF